MEVNIERECSALGGLFQQIIVDMKNGTPLWEDLISKATKLHTCLRAAILAISAYLEAFQKIADAATSARGDSSPPPLRVSVPPSPGFDLTDDGRPGKTSPTSTSKILESSDTEAIEEALPINQKTLPAPEPRPKLEKNGKPYDTTDGKKLYGDDDDNPCVIKCISFAQQCCDCTIL